MTRRVVFSDNFLPTSAIRTQLNVQVRTCIWCILISQSQTLLSLPGTRVILAYKIGILWFCCRQKRCISLALLVICKYFLFGFISIFHSGKLHLEHVSGSPAGPKNFSDGHKKLGMALVYRRQSKNLRT